MSVSKRYRVINGKKRPVYQAEVYSAGIRVATGTFETKAAAHTWHDAQRAAVGEPSAPLVPTLGAIVARYRREHLPTVSTGSAVTMESRMLYIETAPVAALPMDQVTAAAVDQWMDWLLAQPTKDTPWRRTFTNEVIQLSGILNWYREVVDPAFTNQVVKRHHKRAVYKRVESRRPDHFIRVEDIAPWLGQLKQFDEPAYWAMAYFQILSGCRIGEVQGLCWDAVDIEQRRARIFRTSVRDKVTGQAAIRDQVKTVGSNRMIRLPQELVDMLAALGDRTGPVFKLRDGSLPKYGLVNYYYTKAFELLGLPWKATHITRHSWATLGLQANSGNLGAIQAALGHASPAMTNKYAKVYNLMADKTADQVAALLRHHGGYHGNSSPIPKLSAST